MIFNKQLFSAIALFGFGLGFGLKTSAIPIAVDVITVVDESGSMSTEHAWLGGAITSLHDSLNTTAGGDPLSANYGLVGFGGRGANRPGHQHDVGGGQFGTAAEFDTATSTLVTSGGTEDGYDGMSFSLNYNLHANHATNIILVTDEDRDNLSSNTLDYSSMLDQFQLESALLNAVVNCRFKDGNGDSALGIDSNGNAYVSDGNGGFTTSAGGVQSGRCAGSTKRDYVDLALETGGAAWDLNFLRQGGLLADSFTAAFVDIKVAEIIDQQPTVVTEPGTLALFGLAFLGLGLIQGNTRK